MLAVDRCVEQQSIAGDVQGLCHRTLQSSRHQSGPVSQAAWSLRASKGVGKWTAPKEALDGYDRAPKSNDREDIE